MGKDSLFGEPRPAKASVVLKLRSQRQLSASSISGISNMVAASVEGLNPESVVILDSFGRPLARPQPDGDDPLGAGQLERQQRLERDLSTKVIALLEPVVGEERVRVNVALKLNPRTSEETEERYDPNTVVRSVQRTSDVANTGGASGSVAGVRSNLPPQSTDAKLPQATVPGTGTARTAETTNYEVSKTTRRVLQPPGDVARLSVAVILDDDHVQKKQEDGSVTTVRQSRKPEEIQKIQALVAAAVGLDPERGDQLTVENVAFDEPGVEEEKPPSFFVRFAPQIDEFTRLIAVLVVGIAGFFFVVRPMLKSAGFGLKPSPQPAGIVEVQRPRTVADLESEIEAQMDAQELEKASENRRLPVLTRRVSSITQKEPDQVAKLLRGWIREAER
jgi:flagellar M-ring protein FliF